MIEQFETRPLAASVRDEDYFLLCLSESGYVARPITGATLKQFVLEGMPGLAGSLIVRQDDPPPEIYRGIWAEPNETRPDSYWTRLPGDDEWVSLAQHQSSAHYYYVSNAITLYLPIFSEGPSIYLERFNLSGMPFSGSFSETNYWEFTISAKAGNVETDLVSILVDEEVSSGVMVAEGNIELVVPRNQIQILKLTARRTGNAPRLRNFAVEVFSRGMRDVQSNSPQILVN